MQFKLTTIVVACAVAASSAFAATLENRQVAACNRGAGAPCGSLGATILGLTSSASLPNCASGLTCGTLCSVSVGLPSPLPLVTANAMLGTCH
ncbi:hypothetical protein QCA50_004210 [Cerrena zonata]|uniref:Uncharacterized protein n=1 Tax=Cerrena zonata TaxID=2478898 RepID=A0AAW0GH56_9APHY